MDSFMKNHQLYLLDDRIELLNILNYFTTKIEQNNALVSIIDKIKNPKIESISEETYININNQEKEILSDTLLLIKNKYNKRLAKDFVNSDIHLIIENILMELQ